MAVNLTENIEKIDNAIEKFRMEMSEHDDTKQRIENYILRLEGSRIVYEGLRDVFGDVVGDGDGKSNSDCHRKSHTMETVPEEGHGACEHTHPEDDLTKRLDKPDPDDNGDMSLEDLYKKYRAM